MDTHKEIYQDLIYRIKFNIANNTRIIRKDNKLMVYLHNSPLGYLKNV
jgi:hypothetical protein